MHVNDEQGECYLCHDTHGSEQYHLMNFNRNVASCLTAVNPDSQGAYRHAVGTGTNSCVITCHGTGHSTTNKNYQPVY
jgi:predicted CXXCH cytochrome family protein